MKLFIKVHCYQATNREGGWTKNEYYSMSTTPSRISLQRIDAYCVNNKTGGTYIQSLATNHTWDVKETPEQVDKLIEKCLPPGLKPEPWQRDDDDLDGVDVDA